MQELQVVYTPSEIVISERENVEKEIKELAERYKGYEVTAETFASDKKVLSGLRKFDDSFEDRRKAVKEEYNKPLNEFESWTKEARKPLLEVIDHIAKGVAEVVEKSKEIMADVIRAELQEMTKETAIDSRVFEEKISEWCKASNFTKEYKIKKPLKETLEYVVNNEVQRLEEIKKNEELISGFAFDNNLTAGPYLNLLKRGISANEILQTMRDDIAKEKERKAELEAKQKEYETKKLEEEMGAVQEESVIDQQIEVDDVQEAQKDPYPAKLTFEIIFNSLEEKEKFKEILVQNNYRQNVDYKPIKFESLEKEL